MSDIQVRGTRPSQLRIREGYAPPLTQGAAIRRMPQAQHLLDLRRRVKRPGSARRRDDDGDDARDEEEAHQPREKLDPARSHLDRALGLDVALPQCDERVGEEQVADGNEDQLGDWQSAACLDLSRHWPERVLCLSKGQVMGRTCRWARTQDVLVVHVLRHPRSQTQHSQPTQHKQRRTDQNHRPMLRADQAPHHQRHREGELRVSYPKGDTLTYEDEEHA